MKSLAGAARVLSGFQVNFRLYSSAAVFSAACAKADLTRKSKEVLFNGLPHVCRMPAERRVIAVLTFSSPPVLCRSVGLFLAVFV